MENTSPNIGWLFYKDYYNTSREEEVFIKVERRNVKRIAPLSLTEEGKEDAAINEKIFEKRNQHLIQQIRPQSIPAEYPTPQNPFKIIPLETKGQGLLIGSGYNHGSGASGEIEIGFFFDHTTGLPTIPGASVKGVMRSIFPGRLTEAANQAAKQAERFEKTGKTDKAKPLIAKSTYYLKLADDRYYFLIHLLSKVLGIQDFENLESIEDQRAFIDELENEIFEGRFKTQKRDEDNNWVYQEMSIYERDIFHDGLLVKSDHPALPIQRCPAGAILGMDFITPHKNRKSDNFPDQLKNPLPISFIKVLPKVRFNFQFDLKEEYSIEVVDENNIRRREKRNRLLSITEREKLFEAVLTTKGIGAKTNVNFGKLQK